ncbi:MAG TPA: hypothetical protein VF991_13340 [Reyranella sp.]
MKLFKSIVVVSALCVAAAGCESNTKFKEDMLASSGFKPVPPNTPMRLASMKSLPPHRLTKTTYKGKTVWVYPDPTICACLYIGNQAAYDAYVQRQRQRNQLDAATVTVPEQALGWDFAPWAEAAVEP